MGRVDIQQVDAHGDHEPVGRDAFHSVPLLCVEVWDGVESVLTESLPTRFMARLKPPR